MHQSTREGGYSPPDDGSVLRHSVFADIGPSSALGRGEKCIAHTSDGPAEVCGDGSYPGARSAQGLGHVRGGGHLSGSAEFLFAAG